MRIKAIEHKTGDEVLVEISSHTHHIEPESFTATSFCVSWYGKEGKFLRCLSMGEGEFKANFKVPEMRCKECQWGQTDPLWCAECHFPAYGTPIDPLVYGKQPRIQ